MPNRVYLENGQLNLATVYDASGNKVKETSFTYALKASSSLKGVKLFITNPEYDNPFYDDYEFAFGAEGPTNFIAAFIKYYDNLSQWWVQSSMTETTYQGANSLTTTKNSFFDNPNHLLLTREETSNSDGSVLIKKYEYPQDYAGTLPGSPTDNDGIALNDLINRHIIDPPIEQQVFLRRNSLANLVSGELTKYALFNGKALCPPRDPEIGKYYSSFRYFAVRLYG